MRIKSQHDSDMACPKCRKESGIDWNKIVQVCGHCGAEFKLVQTAKRRWVSFLLPVIIEDK